MIHLTKSITILFCIIAISAVVLAQPNNSDQCTNQFEVDYTGYERVKGPVESLDVEREHLVSEGHVLFTNKGKPYRFATYRFDRQGRLLEKVAYRTDGVAMPKTTFEYDAATRLVRENHFSAVSKKPYLETNYAYQNNLLTEISGKNIEDGKWLSRKVFTYEPDRDYFEFTETKSYNSPVLRIGFIQDSRCRFREIFAYDENRNLAVRTVVDYDGFDNPISLIYYSPEGKVLGKRKREYKYDNYNNWIEQSDFSLKTEKGKPEWVLVEIEYRKITYSAKGKME